MNCHHPLQIVMQQNTCDPSLNDIFMSMKTKGKQVLWETIKNESIDARIEIVEMLTKLMNDKLMKII